MPNVQIGENVTIHKSIIGNGTVINDRSIIGEMPPSSELTVIGEELVIPALSKIQGIFDGEA